MSTLKFYISAPVPEAEFAKRIASDLQRLFPGSSVPGWMYNSPGYLDGEQLPDKSELDLQECIDCDIFIYVGADGSRGGRFAELGMALATGKPIYALGKKSCIFDWNKRVTWVDSILSVYFDAVPTEKWALDFHTRMGLGSIRTPVPITSEFVKLPKDEAAWNKQLHWEADLRKDGIPVGGFGRNGPTLLFFGQEWHDALLVYPPEGDTVLVVRDSGVVGTNYEYLSARWTGDYKGWTGVDNYRLSDSGDRPLYWTSQPAFPLL